MKLGRVNGEKSAPRHVKFGDLCATGLVGIKWGESTSEPNVLHRGNSCSFLLPNRLYVTDYMMEWKIDLIKYFEFIVVFKIIDI